LTLEEPVGIQTDPLRGYELEQLTARRPPTGPLTTSEKTAAEELRQETLVKDNEGIERENGESGLPP
jgi:hypothetical protein